MMSPPTIHCYNCNSPAKHILEYSDGFNMREWTAYCSGCGIKKLVQLLKDDVEVEVHKMIPYPENRC